MSVWPPAVPGYWRVTFLGQGGPDEARPPPYDRIFDHIWDARDAIGEQLGRDGYDHGEIVALDGGRQCFYLEVDEDTGEVGVTYEAWEAT